MDTLDALRLIFARDFAPGWGASEWGAVHEAVTAWDAAPLAWAAVKGRAAEVPPEIAAAWRKDHTATTAVNLRLAFEAEALVGALAAVGVRACPLKGTALFALGVYRDPGSRPTSDVDLLVEEGSERAVKEALRARGYAQTRAGGPKHWPPFVRDGVMVEIHDHAFWSLADGHRVRVGEMIDRAGRPDLPGIAAHLLHHLFESSVTTGWLVVKTLSDLGEIQGFLERGGGAAGVRARDVAEGVTRVGLGRRLGALAGLRERVTGARGPEVWLRDLRDRDVDALLARCSPRARRLDEALRLPDRVAAFARMPAREKAALARHHLLPDPEQMRALHGLPEGSPWVWPLYPLRPFLVAGRSAIDAGRLLAARVAAARRGGKG